MECFIESIWVIWHRDEIIGCRYYRKSQAVLLLLLITTKTASRYENYSSNLKIVCCFYCSNKGRGSEEITHLVAISSY